MELEPKHQQREPEPQNVGPTPIEQLAKELAASIRTTFPKNLPIGALYQAERLVDVLDSLLMGAASVFETNLESQIASGNHIPTQEVGLVVSSISGVLQLHACIKHELREIDMAIREIADVCLDSELMEKLKSLRSSFEDLRNDHPVERDSDFPEVGVIRKFAQEFGPLDVLENVSFSEYVDRMLDTIQKGDPEQQQKAAVKLLSTMEAIRGQRLSMTCPLIMESRNADPALIEVARQGEQDLLNFIEESGLFRDDKNLSENDLCVIGDLQAVSTIDKVLSDVVFRMKSFIKDELMDVASLNGPTLRVNGGNSLLEILNDLLTTIDDYERFTP